MYKFLFLLALIPGVAFALNPAPCTFHTGPLPVEVRVVGCPPTVPQQPCIVPIGSMVDSEIDFILERPTTTLKASLDMFLGNFRIPWNLPAEQEDACQDLMNGVSCPLVGVGERIIYNLVTEVSAPFAGVTVDMELMLTDDQGQAVFCYRSQATVV
ncbi:uncharacterized protein LOC131677248 [Topomyia yanbarensis]|uniref:uncharacterized protein LOC131677248 n=1 Tax=Topomyia yanbarensis TaxID=2498891 RepID=UPI00273B5466|nr:uncharacterized protein LOC131677248 [Topomyia yanbarensis]